MIGETNVGGGAKTFAIISVTYPEGSTCTCSNGTKTLKAKDTSGKALFNVSTGTWTVTATDGNKTKDATVNITTEGQFESVLLRYSLDIIVNGKFNQDVTGSWLVGNHGPGSMGENSNGYVRIYAPLQDAYNGSYTDWVSGKALPTSEYSTMYVDYAADLNGYASQFISLGGVSVATNSASSDARNTRAVDISGLTSDYQMTLIARAWAGNGGVSIRIYNLYFE